MYNSLELKELTIKPKINDISLDVLREFYEIASWDICSERLNLFKLE